MDLAAFASVVKPKLFLLAWSPLVTGAHAATFLKLGEIISLQHKCPPERQALLHCIIKRGINTQRTVFAKLSFLKKPDPTEDSALSLALDVLQDADPERGRNSTLETKGLPKP